MQEELKLQPLVTLLILLLLYLIEKDQFKFTKLLLGWLLVY